MLQQDQPEDFVIATGEQYSVRDFVNAAAKELGMTLRWEGKGLDEVGILVPQSSSLTPRPSALSTHPQRERIIVAVDPRYFSPTEVETLLGDATKAKTKLGWTPKTTFAELVAEMVREDLKVAERDELVRRHGHKALDFHE